MAKKNCGCSIQRNYSVDALRHTSPEDFCEWISYCSTHAAAFEMREAIQEHIINMDKLLTPTVWRSLQPVERGQAIASHLNQLQRAFSLAEGKEEKK